MKLQTTAAILCCLFGMTSALAAQNMKPGTYEGSGQGINGAVTVTVTVDTRKITAIKVVSHKETLGVGSKAVDLLPEAIVKNQSLAVDTISGATVTSKALKDAVSQALKKAGADPKALMVPVAKPSGKAQTIDAEFVIIGAGGSGQIAAIRAGQLGVKTVIIEKMPILGGAFGIHGGWMLIQGSRLQKELGVDNDSPNAMIHDFLANGHFVNDLPKLSLYADRVGQTINWLEDYVGVKYNKKAGLQRQGEYIFDRVVFYEGGTPAIQATYEKALRRDQNVKVVTGARAEELIIKDGKAVGVKATLDGAPLTVNAKAVLISSGGYGNNKDMLVEPIKSALYYGPVCSTGDGHRMAAAAGAELVHMSLGKIYPNGVEVAPGLAKSVLFANNSALEVSGILVNSQGQRVVDEKASNNAIKQKMMSDPKHEFFMFMDEESFKAFKAGLSVTGVTESDADEWLANDGKKLPLLVKGATIKEVAGKAGIDGAALEKTVTRYNQLVAGGKDEDFGRPVAFMKKQIAAQGPYYICEQKPRFATTLGAVKANDKLEVMKTDGTLIGNLFVAGEATNVVHGDDSPVGANVAWAATSGKFVAEQVAKRLGKEK